MTLRGIRGGAGRDQEGGHQRGRAGEVIIMPASGGGGGGGSGGNDVGVVGVGDAETATASCAACTTWLL